MNRFPPVMIAAVVVLVLGYTRTAALAKTINVPAAECNSPSRATAAPPFLSTQAHCPQASRSVGGACPGP